MRYLTVVILFCLYGMSYQEDWSYDFETLWPGVCTTGEQQSPINIMTRDTVLDVDGAHIRGPLVFRGYQNVALSAINNGHTLRWNNVDDIPPIISGGPLRGNYTFMQFHLHWLSEHAIDGIKYPLEIHLVHIKTGLTLEEAVLRPDGLAVIGVMGQVVDGRDNTHALEELMPSVPELIEKSSTDTDPPAMDLTRLIPSDYNSYFTYHGSLTTPQCEEVVTWIVMETPLSISDVQYKVFGDVDVGGIDNYRSLQRVNRVVYRSVASCSMALVPGLLSTFAALFSCLVSKIPTSLSKGLCYISNLKRKLCGNVLKECSKVSVS